MSEHQSRSTAVGSGCLFGVGLFFAAMAVMALRELQYPAAAVMAFMGLLPVWLGWNLLGAAQRQAKELVMADRARIERRLLELAAANHGRVNPTLATLKIPGLSIAAAKELLAKLAADGFCAVDSDDHGRVVYLFPVGVALDNQSELSPDEWVEQMQTRLTGHEQTGSADVNTRTR